MTAQPQILPIRDQNKAIVQLSSVPIAKRILLVDNQAHVLRVMKSTLDRGGYDVETASSAEMALTEIRESHFDVVVIDNGLETLNGQQLIYTIEDQFRDRAPVMFLLTDHNTDFLQHWCSQFDRTECLEKPLSISYLDDRIAKLFGT